MLVQTKVQKQYHIILILCHKTENLLMTLAVTQKPFDQSSCLIKCHRHTSKWKLGTTEALLDEIQCSSVHLFKQKKFKANQNQEGEKKTPNNGADSTTKINCLRLRDIISIPFKTLPRIIICSSRQPIHPASKVHYCTLKLWEKWRQGELMHFAKWAKLKAVFICLWVAQIGAPLIITA